MSLYNSSVFEKATIEFEQCGDGVSIELKLAIFNFKTRFYFDNREPQLSILLQDYARIFRLITVFACADAVVKFNLQIIFQQILSGNFTHNISFSCDVSLYRSQNC